MIEKSLGRKVVVVNKPGAAGAVATAVLTFGPKASCSGGTP